MDNKFKMIILCGLAFLSLLIGATNGFAWHDYAEYSDGWNYHGSGRDHAYSEYINRPHYMRYDYLTFGPDDMDVSSYTLSSPVIVAPPQPDVFTVNIPNGHGGYTPIIIKRLGTGFIGPQGEFYPEFPKVFQLKIIYGK